MNEKDEGLRVAKRLARLGVIPEATLWIGDTKGGLTGMVLKWIIILLLAVIAGVFVAMVKERNLRIETHQSEP